MAGITGAPSVRQRSASLRNALLQPVGALLLLLLVSGAALLVVQWNQQRALAFDRLRAEVDQVRSNIDREISLDLAVLRTLAASPDVDRQDWAALHESAKAAASVRAGSWVVIGGPAQQRYVNTLLPYGTPLPSLGGAPERPAAVEWNGRRIPFFPPELVTSVLQTGQPSFSGLVFGPAIQGPILTTTVPAVREGVPRYALSLAYRPDFFTRMLQAQSARDGLIWVIFDRTGLVIARSAGAEAFVGRPAAPPFDRGAALPEPRGSGEAVSLEGTPVFYAYSRSELSGWTVGVGVARNQVLAPARRVLWNWSALLLAVGAIGMLLAHQLWRRLAKPLAALAEQARAVDADPTPPPRSGIEDIDLLGQALAEGATNRRIRRQAELQRESAERRFRLVVEASPVAKVMVDGKGIICLVNRRVEQLFGYPREALIGQPVEMLLPQAQRVGHAAQRAGYLARAESRAMGAGRELTGLRNDGSEVPVEVGLVPVEIGDERYTLASIVDVSERRQADAQRARLASIVESSADAIMSFTLDGRITSWNRGAESIFGYAAAETVGQPLQMLLQPGDQAAQLELQDVLRLLRAGDTVEPFDAVRRRKDGGLVDVSIRISPLKTASGELTGASGIVRDITEAKQRDAELKRSNADLEQFAYVASHDLQEPLRMVANYTELLAERYRGQLDERADKYIHYASDGARRMQRLVSDLLAYSRVGSRGGPLVEVDSGAVLARVLQTLRQPMSESGAELEAGELPRVLADEGQLHQLLQNLISNALKYRAEAPPRVRVNAQREGAHWRFEVADNGIGLDMRYAERIFQMFQRLHEIGRYEGSGIGLAIAKRIVERHGGRIGVDSVPGRGSTFFFTLSAASDPS